MDSKKVLVAYFSCTGTTARAAHELACAASADLYEIQPAQPYTAADINWMDKSSRSSREMADENFRPKILGRVENMESYGVVFVGFPIWWYVAPRIIQTFLESYDFSGKTVVPFFTSGGSGAGKTDRILHECCPAAHWLPGMHLGADVTAEGLRRQLSALSL